MFKYKSDAINSIVTPIITNTIIQASQPFNNTIYPDETGKKPDKISIITIPILANSTSTCHLPRPLPKTSNSSILQTIGSLTVQRICIDGENVSTIIWAEWKIPTSITWIITNIFTSKINVVWFHNTLPNHPQLIYSLHFFLWKHNPISNKWHWCHLYTLLLFRTYPPMVPIPANPKYTFIQYLIQPISIHLLDTRTIIYIFHRTIIHKQNFLNTTFQLVKLYKSI